MLPFVRLTPFLSDFPDAHSWVREQWDIEVRLPLWELSPDGKSVWLILVRNCISGHEFGRVLDIGEYRRLGPRCKARGLPLFVAVRVKRPLLPNWLLSGRTGGWASTWLVSRATSGR